VGSPGWTRRPLPPVTHTDALFAGQSHSILDNLVALLAHSRACNCSPKLRPVLGRMQDQPLRFQITDAQTSASKPREESQSVPKPTVRPYTWNDCCRYGLPTFADPVVKGKVAPKPDLRMPAGERVKATHFRPL